MNSYAKGKSAEDKALAKIRHQGFTQIRRPFSNAYDVVVNNARVEIKYALPSEEGVWVVNIHRHGIIREDEVDAYVFCLDKVPGGEKTRTPVYLVFISPLRTPTVHFTFKSLVTRYAANIENWELLKDICRKRSDSLGVASGLREKAGRVSKKAV